jgi:hypothetical protein
MVVHTLIVHVAINNRTDSNNDWIVWLDVPDRDALGIANEHLYDDNANPLEVEVYTWEDETPSSVQAAHEAGYIDGLT